MVTRERIDDRSDEPQELRERYNQLCAALAFGAGANATSGDRLLQELQSLAQRIVAIEARRANLESNLTSPAALTAPAGPAISGKPDHVAAQQPASPRVGNVIAFRFKMKGTADQQPGVIADIDVRKPIPGRGDKSKARMAQPEQVAAGSPAGSSELRTAIIAQGEAIVLISSRCDDHRDRLTRIEEQVATKTGWQQISADVAALRDGSEKQRQQLIVLATAVHRLARLLANDSNHDATV